MQFVHDFCEINPHYLTLNDIIQRKVGSTHFFIRFILLFRLQRMNVSKASRMSRVPVSVATSSHPYPLLLTLYRSWRLYELLYGWLAFPCWEDSSNLGIFFAMAR